MRDSRAGFAVRNVPRFSIVWLWVLCAPAFGADPTLDDAMKPRLDLSVGWALGSTSNAFNPALEAPGNEKFDAEPLIHLNAFLGGARVVSTDVKLVLGNFGRLVNRDALAAGNFSPDSSGTSVRRALIADLSLRTGYSHTWGDHGGFAWTLINTGFIFDAQQDPDSTHVLDAASYVFTGPTIFGMLTENSYVHVDLLFGTSELLTGIEAFDFQKQNLRFRPRLKFRIHQQKWGPVDIGFWGDLGWAKRQPDAFTAFIALPLLKAQP